MSDISIKVYNVTAPLLLLLVVTVTLPFSNTYLAIEHKPTNLQPYGAVETDHNKSFHVLSVSMQRPRNADRPPTDPAPRLSLTQRVGVRQQLGHFRRVQIGGENAKRVQIGNVVSANLTFASQLG